jgi:hypothetical protein
MAEQKRRLRYWVVGESWREGWFLLSLFAGLFWGAPGLIGAVTSYAGLRAVGSKLPRPLAVAAALAVAIATSIATEALMRA